MTPEDTVQHITLAIFFLISFDLHVIDPMHSLQIIAEYPDVPQTLQVCVDIRGVGAKQAMIWDWLNCLIAMVNVQNAAVIVQRWPVASEACGEGLWLARCVAFHTQPYQSLLHLPL